MKKITLLVVFVTLFLGTKHSQAQVNLTTVWPDSEWEVTGDFGLGAGGDAFTHNPTDNPYTTPTPGTNFGYDDDAAGSGSLQDHIEAVSPEIDLTSATTVGQNQVVISGDYVYTPNSDILSIEWYDNDAHVWLPWYTFQGNSSSYDYLTCSGMQSYTSTPLIIEQFTSSQLLHFRYRFRFNDNARGFGFCMGAPSINSEETPLCLEVSDINTDSAEIEYDTAVISWTNNSITPQDGWEVEYGETNFTQGSGTVIGTYTNPHTISGLEANTCYDVYIRALCDNDTNTTSEWAGPLNFCTPSESLHCGSDYFDNGGPSGDYSSSFTSTDTVTPDIAGNLVTVIFNSFILETGGFGSLPYDWLKIYDGDSTSSPQIVGPDLGGTFSGTNSPGMITASEDLTVNPTGSLTFEFKSDSSGQKMGWQAKILCSPPITCFIPEDLAVNEASITIHEAEISWTDTNTDAGEPTSGWDVEYGPIGFAQGAGTVVNAPLNENPFTLTNLDPATEYCYYVKANCGDVSGDEDSFWQGPVCFTTKCDIFPTPYSENFDNGGDTPACWNQGANNSENWLFANDVTAPGHIGNGGNVGGTTTLSGGYFAYVDDDAPDSLNTSLLSPFIDLTGIVNPTLGFYYISHHEFLFQSVNFSVDVWDGTTWTEGVFTHTGNTNGWEQIFVDLSAFDGDIIQLKFIVDENTASIFDDFAIDDVFVGEMPACVNVNSVSLDNVGSTNATFTWNDGNNPEATNWQIIYGVPGFDPNVGTPEDTTNNNGYPLDGLDDQTDYEVYIRANCGNGAYSLWAGPIAFTTLCPIFDAPFLEDFEDGGILDACWSQSAGIESWQFATTPGAGDAQHVGNNGNVFGTVTESGNYFAFIDDSTPEASNNAISTPMINVATLASPTLYFYYVSHNEGDSNVSFSIDVWDGTAWNTDFYTSNNNSDNGWEQVILDLTGLNITGAIQIKFIVNEDNGTDFSDDFAIDDVEVKNAPDCWPIFNPVVSNETTTTMDIAWLDNDNDVPPTTYYIEYGHVGFTQGTGTIQNVDMSTTTYNPYTVTGLAVDTDFDFYVCAVCPNGVSCAGPVQGATLPTCMEISGFTIGATTTTSVEVSWVDNNDTPPPGGWDVEVTFPSFGQGTGQVGNTLTTPSIVIASPTYNNIIPSSTYEVYVRANCEADGSDPSRWTGPFTINTQVGPPINDTCDTAYELNVTEDCEPILGNNIQATQTSPALATNCTDPAVDGTTTSFVVDDVWYKFTMPATGTVLIKTGFAGVMDDSAMAVYRASDTSNPCGSLVFAESLLPNGNINYALSSCSDDDDFDLDNDYDNNLFSSVMIKNQTPGEEYYVRVWSVDRSNIPGESNVHGQFTICVIGQPSAARLALATNNSTVNNDEFVLDYYPNPVSNTLNLSSNSTIKEIEIYSLLGQRVANYNFNDLTVMIDTKTLQPGAYFVKVMLDNDRTKTIKIIKN